MATSVQTATIRTQVPSRLDRLPWSKFHWRVVIGLGTVWILDGLEVTMVGSVAARLTDPDSGINLSAGQIGIAAAIYVVGACSGALYFGHLTDRFGRKRLFILTLAVYITATVATAFAFSPWYFYIARFFTGAGIGGEYAAINSAIDELIPARVRGRVDLIINGSYWLGAAAGAASALFFLNTAIFPADIGWRVAFGVGAILGLGILLVRRNVPESPRWLFIHGRQDEAERIVDGIERYVREDTNEELSEPDTSITVRQRRVVPFRVIAKTAFTVYPRRTILGLALFTGQAFMYNGITFNLGTLLSTFFGVASAVVPIYIVLYALSNFLGPVTLGRLFDTVGRIPMIAGAYLGSALLTIPLALLFVGGSLNSWTFLAFVLGIFFLASAGASAAYLTVSEIFPMETRALAIAFFYAVGTAAGGITGPLLFGQLIGTEVRSYVMLAFLIGAGVMALGGIAELFLGVRAERANLEDIAKPLTAQEAEEGTQDDSGEGEQAASRHTRGEQRNRQAAEQERARAAEHRAAALELRGAAAGDKEGAAARATAEEVLADIADVRAESLDEQKEAHALLGEAEEAQDQYVRRALLERAQAAEQRARQLKQQGEAISADNDTESERHSELAAAAGQRARAREQRALVQHVMTAADEEETDRAVRAARAEMHQHWAEMHESRAQAHLAAAEGDSPARERAQRQAAEHEAAALAAEQRVTATEHRLAADNVHAERAGQEEITAPGPGVDETEQRIRERVERRERREHSGLRRFRPGPGRVLSTGRTGGVEPERAAEDEQALDREIEIIARALEEQGPTQRSELSQLIGARYWGPGRFGEALREAVSEGRIHRLSRRTYGPIEHEPG